MDDQFNHIEDVIRRFDPISLGEMDAVKLMNRTDVKFVFHTAKLRDLLARSMDHYFVLQIDHHRDFLYHSLYYDTPGLDLYTAHHNGSRPRFKVRFRQYVDTGTTFLEVKQKTNKERTRKSRIQVAEIETELSDGSTHYIEKQSPLQAAGMTPALWTIFKRITLVGKNSLERITIDHELSFKYGDQEKQLPFLTISEVKRDSFAGQSAFTRIQKELSIHPGNSSKYCLGTVLLKDHVKHNRFKRNIIKLNQLENDYRSYHAAG